jgi:hypothetical protein
MRRVEGGKMEGESCWKSGGERTCLYTWPRVGLADEASSGAIPEAAGGEWGHGAAKPHGVIHRYGENQSQERAEWATNCIGASSTGPALVMLDQG